MIRLNRRGELFVMDRLNLNREGMEHLYSCLLECGLSLTDDRAKVRGRVLLKESTIMEVLSSCHETWGKSRSCFWVIPASIKIKNSGLRIISFETDHFVRSPTELY